MDADTGEVVIETGRKLTVRTAKQLAEKGVKFIRATDEDMVGLYIAEDVVNMMTGEIYAEAGDEITEKLLKVFDGASIEELSILDIDHVNIGPYIRNTLPLTRTRAVKRRCSTSTA